YRVDENLRLGTDYHPWEPKTHFKYREDSGSFAHAALRCVGIGNCRREHGGTMCPSYMATREEQHSTRGRSRLLFEMLQGEIIQGGWREESVREALDLCLACKGCKGDCPVNVDMATYKSEFLSHYYRGHLRPRHAYAIGLIHRASHLAAWFPALANLLTQTPGPSAIAKAIAGIAPERRIPAYAPQTFKKWFKQHRGIRNEQTTGNGGLRPAVILWADTFNNHFHPSTARAAVEVLESAGYRVRVPRKNLCCGRQLYDYGMLDSAKRLLQQTLEALRSPIRAGIPIVVLEPSCAAVFRDELVNLYPQDEDARRLSQQTFLLSEFLEKRVADYQPPKLRRKAIVHGHCHQRAIMTMDSDQKILKKMNLDYTLLDSGCCGMAGGFGFEKEHYEISLQIGERVLLPAVRQADSDTLVIADGFSCREQISQTTHRRALHLAEVIRMAIRGTEDGIYTEEDLIPAATGAFRSALLAGVLIAGAGFGYATLRRKK
ncbi:MAG: (Fe-S)-binding protein, partial [Terriglobia bacterium]